MAYRDEGDVQAAGSDRGQVGVMDVTDTRVASQAQATCDSGAPADGRRRHRRPLQQAPVIAVLTIDGQHDTFTTAGDWAAYRAKSAGNEHRVLPVGQRPAARRTARARTQAVIDTGRL